MIVRTACTMRAVQGLLIVALIVAAPSPANAYLQFGTSVGGRTITLKWAASPVRYFISDVATVPGVTITQFQAALGRAFTTWQNLPTASIDFQFVAFTTARPFDDDNLSTLGFLDRPELERVLATTDILLDSRTGAIIESDIFFNSNFPWSVAPAGESGRYDIESIALHEIGHMIGLGHSALGETELQADGTRRVLATGAVMFPIAFSAGNINDRSLTADDIAGASDIYPDGGFSDETGVISGRVTLNGRGIFGAHVVAFNPVTGALIGGFSLGSDGSFSIAGLSPGPHILRVEPLDDADLDSFFSPTTTVELNFKVGFHDRLVVVPRGGETRVEVRVVPK